MHEQSGGSGRVSFDFRVVAKRKGLEGTRLQSLEELDAEEAVFADPRDTAPARIPVDAVDGELNRTEVAPVMPQNGDGAKAGSIRQAKPRPTAPKSTFVDTIQSGLPAATIGN